MRAPSYSPSFQPSGTGIPLGEGGGYSATHCIAQTEAITIILNHDMPSYAHKINGTFSLLFILSLVFFFLTIDA
jgi:hypothetical protein